METIKSILLREDGSLSFISKLVLVGGLLAVAFIVIKVIRNVLLKALVNKFSHGGTRNTKRLKTLVSLMKSVTMLVVLLVWLFVSLGIFNIDAKGLIATAGIGGLVLGFAAKSFIEDFISGFLILVDNSFNVGDYVSVAGKEGVVEDISLRITTIKDYNGELHTIPNSLIKIVTNRSKNVQRATVDVQIAYEADLSRAKMLLESGLVEKFKSEKHIVDGPTLLAPFKLLDSGILFRVIAYVTPGEQWRIERELREEIKSIFDCNGIEIPYNKMDVNLYSKNNA